MVLVLGLGVGVRDGGIFAEMGKSHTTISFEAVVRHFGALGGVLSGLGDDGIWRLCLGFGFGDVLEKQKMSIDIVGLLDTLVNSETLILGVRNR